MEEKSKLWQLIQDSQQGSKESVLILYMQFMPLLKKYSKYIDDEDAFSELTLCFLKLLDKIPIYSNSMQQEDKYILSYIKNQ